MTNTTSEKDLINWNENEGKLPSMLNVLTILTFIGSGLQLISSAWAYSRAQKTFDDVQTTMDKLGNSPTLKAMMGPNPLELTRRSLENKMPILILGLIGAGLCIYGAIEMRKRKKQGFWIYLVGELLPIVAMVVFVGLNLYGTVTLVSSSFFIVLFIILYATQLKYLNPQSA